MNLELNNICKSFDSQVVLQDICFHEDITSVAVIGPSGGGKSTLIRIIGGLQGTPQRSNAIRVR